jgi:GxxExxY protein
MKMMQERLGMRVKENEDKGCIIYKTEAYEIVRCAMEVSNILGAGFLEAVYQEAMEIELKSAGINFEPKKRLSINYKGKTLNKEYEADIVCFGKIIVELKALERITGIEEAQTINYLKATGMKLGLILNFGNPRLEWKRYVL